ncbi:MAG: hypothetical protein WCE63_06235 [Acidobacteriaceae bacterium]
MAKVMLYLPDGKLRGFSEITEVTVEHGVLSFNKKDDAGQTSYSTKKVVTNLPFFLEG